MARPTHPKPLRSSAIPAKPQPPATRAQDSPDQPQGPRVRGPQAERGSRRPKHPTVLGTQTGEVTTNEGKRTSSHSPPYIPRNPNIHPVYSQTLQYPSPRIHTTEEVILLIQQTLTPMLQQALAPILPTVQQLTERVTALEERINPRKRATPNPATRMEEKDNDNHA